MAETLEGNSNRHAGTHFLLSLCCSFPAFLIYYLPDLSDEQPLSQTSFKGGEELLTDRETFPF